MPARLRRGQHRETISLRLPPDLLDQLRDDARAGGETVTDLIERRLRKRPPPPTHVADAVTRVRELVSQIDDLAAETADALDAVEDAVALPLPDGSSPD